MRSITYREPQVNFYVQDVERSVRFYVDHFGFVETFRTPEIGTPDHVELQMGGMLLGFASNQAALKDHGLVTGAGRARAEVCLWCHDTDAAYADLLRHGAQSLSAPHDFLGGRLRAAWIADPDGNPVQIVAEAKVAVGAAG